MSVVDLLVADAADMELCPADPFEGTHAFNDDGAVYLPDGPNGWVCVSRCVSCDLVVLAGRHAGPQEFPNYLLGYGEGVFDLATGILRSLAPCTAEEFLEVLGEYL